MFTKKDLKAGYVVSTKNKEKHILINLDSGKYGKGSIHLYTPQTSTSDRKTQSGGYNNDLTHIIFSTLDIVKVWGWSKLPAESLTDIVDNRELLWEREEPKYYLTLSRECFSEETRYLNCSIEKQSYFFSTKNEFKSFPDIKTQFTKAEAEDLLDKITHRTGIEEVKKEGEQ